MLQIEWTCQTCNYQSTMSSIEKLQHMSTCKKENAVEDDSQKSMPSSSKKKNVVAYECPDCQKTLYLAPTEVLKHRKQHET